MSQATPQPAKGLSQLASSQPIKPLYTVLRRTQRKYWTSELRAATGRSAVRYMLDLARPSMTFMPAYVPEGIICPFKYRQAPYAFYRLNPDLTPDLNDLNGRLQPGCMVIVIHYFGYPSPTHELKVMLDDIGGYLFEDCAHTLYGKVNEANDADVALWSLNKFMPVIDGAILKSRDPRINVNRAIVSGSGLTVEARQAYRRHLDLNAAGYYPEGAAAYEEYYKEISSDYMLSAQSQESKLIESQFDIEAEHRVRNANALTMETILPSWRKGSYESPQFAYPIRLDSVAHREAVERKLLELGILAVRQVDKWNHIPSDLYSDFVNETAFMFKHLLLPLGETLGHELLGQVAGAI